METTSKSCPKNKKYIFLVYMFAKIQNWPLFYNGHRVFISVVESYAILFSNNSIKIKTKKDMSQNKTLQIATKDKQQRSCQTH